MARPKKNGTYLNVCIDPSNVIRAKNFENSSIRSLTTAMNHYSGNLDIISASRSSACHRWRRNSRYCGEPHL